MTMLSFIFSNRWKPYRLIYIFGQWKLSLSIITFDWNGEPISKIMWKSRNREYKSVCIKALVSELMLTIIKKTTWEVIIQTPLVSTSHLKINWHVFIAFFMTFVIHFTIISKLSKLKKIETFNSFTWIPITDSY